MKSKNSNFNIGKVLKLYRKENGFSVEQISKILNESNYPVSIKTIYKWESGESQPELKILNLLSNIYNITIGAFFEENISYQALNESENKFISYLRNNELYRKIISFITKNDKEAIKNGNKTII